MITSAIGVSLQGALLIGVLAARMRTLGGVPGAGLPRITDPQMALDAAVQAHLTRAGHEAFRQALAQGLHATFVLGLGAVLLGLALVVLYMPGGSVLDLAPAEGIAGGGDGAGNGEAG